MTRPTCTALTCALLLGSAAPAQDGPQLLRQQFARLDQNGDGFLSRPEFPGSDRQFAAIDKDRDGKASAAEYLASDVAARFLRASEQNRKEARPRPDVDALALRWFEQLQRFDQDRDGRISKAEWRGSEQAFLLLDQDGDGDLDRDDRAEAAAAAPPPPPPLPEWRGELPDPAQLLTRLDKDKDGKLSRREIQAQPKLEPALAVADRDGDGAVDEAELRALLAALLQQRQADDRARGRPQPYEVPFDTWDQDQDGKLQQNEWRGPRQLFVRIDLDRDAAVGRDEVARYKQRVLGDDFLERFDLDGDGKVTLAEFGGPADAFRRADRNGDSVITKSDR